jgi:protein TonB
MPETMFTEVVCPHASANRKWYTVPLSLVVHASVFAIVVVTPLVATNDLPSPPTSTLPYIVADVLPPPPPVAPAPRAAETVATIASSQAAPVQAPEGIGVETGIVPNDAPIHTKGVDGLLEGLGASGIVADLPPPAPAPPQPVRVGGDITPPTRIKHVVPQYPLIAKANKVQGVVIIEAIIGTDGKVERAQVIRSIHLLDQAALDAVRAWEYTPTLLNGRPTPVIMTVTVRFVLQ